MLQDNIVTGALASHASRVSTATSSDLATGVERFDQQEVENRC